jgi:hypothetical protein
MKGRRSAVNSRVEVAPPWTIAKSEAAECLKSRGMNSLTSIFAVSGSLTDSAAGRGTWKRRFELLKLIYRLWAAARLSLLKWVESINLRVREGRPGSFSKSCRNPLRRQTLWPLFLRSLTLALEKWTRALTGRTRPLMNMATRFSKPALVPVLIRCTLTRAYHALLPEMNLSPRKEE